MSILSVRAARSQRPQGVILYEGPSMLDGEPIIVIATGLQGAYGPRDFIAAFSRDLIAAFPSDGLALRPSLVAAVSSRLVR